MATELPVAHLESLDPEKTFFVETEDSSFVLHLTKGLFYVRRTTSKDPRYCLVTKINGKNKYKESDLDLYAELSYIHPKLNQEVLGGKIKSVALR
ncbi:MAG: hypothetical protein QT08_C0011G0019 [archaeon GW2011_AR17]|nr:MAG: hypothetical protein QT08_C0011G0019 [archaeon GW2011_AR17]MBS3154476.1 hypothetical protein [Candidatus Woesearchaeota archaeon]HIH15123.1 hypothetical protein [Nanoarchaeota archaeon]HIH59389.1 hypothetical protein [Nanoarchaeota archaeon]HII14523.1 hypothetical protein [Nanoarchaeota archaeon]